MQRLLISLSLWTLLGIGTINAQDSQSTFIYFQSDQSTLDSEDQQELSTLLDKLETHSTFQIDIIGHTDQDGSDNYNQELAQKRTLQTFDYLTGLGCPESALNYKWMGERALANTDETLVAKQQNRRVELKYEVYDFDSIDDLTSQISDATTPIQKYSISAENKLIDLEHGASLFVAHDAFVYPDGIPVTGQVDIEVIEAYKMTDFMTHGLITQSKGEMLETGGMLYINATVNGQQVELDEGRSLEIIYPVQELEKGMELFYAEESEDGIVWTPTETALRTTQVKNDPLMINIDEVLNYDFGKIEKPVLQFEDMPSRPSFGDKPFPPSEKLYSTTKYNELYANYEENLATWHNRKPHYEKELEEWNKEVSRRINKIQDYRNALLEMKYKVKVYNAMRGLRKMEGRRAPVELIERIFSFVNRPMRINVDDRKMYTTAFQNHTRGLMSERSLEVNNEGYLVYPRNSEYYNNLKTKIFEAKKLIAEKMFEESGDIDRENFGSYIANISQLGWINCDRFTGGLTDRELSNVIIEDVPEDTRVYMIYKDIRSFLLKRSKEASSLTFKNSAVGEPVKIVGVQLVDGKPMMAVKEVTIEHGQRLSLDFLSCTLKQIRGELNSVDPTIQKSTQNNYDLSLKVFPNPTTEAFTAEVIPADKLNELSIYDLSGQLMKTVNNQNTQDQISVSDFSNGVYVVTATFENGQRATERMVVKN